MRILYKKRLKSEMFDKIEKLFGNLMQLAGYKKIHFMVIFIFSVMKLQVHQHYYHD